MIYIEIICISASYCLSNCTANAVCTGAVNAVPTCGCQLQYLLSAGKCGTFNRSCLTVLGVFFFPSHNSQLAYIQATFDVVGSATTSMFHGQSASRRHCDEPVRFEQPLPANQPLRHKHGLQQHCAWTLCLQRRCVLALHDIRRAFMDHSSAVILIVQPGCRHWHWSRHRRGGVGRASLVPRLPSPQELG